MSTKITLLDYGMCNMLNVARALEHAGADVRVTEDPRDAVAAERLVVPGVGAFSECMRAVNVLGHGDAIREFVKSGRTMLGICVGMQILFEASEEFGETPRMLELVERTPGPGEIAVKLRAASINPLDAVVAAGYLAVHGNECRTSAGII